MGRDDLILLAVLVAAALLAFADLARVDAAPEGGPVARVDERVLSGRTSPSQPIPMSALRETPGGSSAAPATLTADEPP